MSLEKRWTRSVERMELVSTAVIDLSITLAARWQQTDIDHIRPMNEATALAGMDLWSRVIAEDSELIDAFIFLIRGAEIRNVNDDKSTIVPSAFIEWRGKNEHFSIWSDSPKLAASYTMRIDNASAARNALIAAITSSMLTRYSGGLTSCGEGPPVSS